MLGLGDGQSQIGQELIGVAGIAGYRYRHGSDDQGDPTPPPRQGRNRQARANTGLFDLLPLTSAPARKLTPQPDSDPAPPPSSTSPTNVTSTSSPPRPAPSRVSRTLAISPPSCRPFNPRPASSPPTPSIRSDVTLARTSSTSPCRPSSNCWQNTPSRPSSSFRSFVRDCGAWTSTGITVCSLCSCWLCLNARLSSR